MIVCHKATPALYAHPFFGGAVVFGLVPTTWLAKMRGLAPILMPIFSSEGGGAGAKFGHFEQV